MMQRFYVAWASGLQQSLLAALFTASLTHADWPPPRPLDEDRFRSAGIRAVETEHATLVTDSAASPAIDALPRLIDLAVPLWAARFGDATPVDWRLRVYLIEDEVKFRSLGLWPEKSPDFPHGLSLGHEVWLRQQTSDYYRRHLLLHEGTHSYMSTRLGSCGPGWYMEGMAELCGTHSWDGRWGEQSLRLAVMPSSKETAPDWGRVRLVRDAVAAGRRLSIDAVRKIDNRVVLEAESYAWVWALCHFLDHHPAYRERFGLLPGSVTSDDFDRRLRRLYSEDRDRRDQEWRLFLETLCYGHDLQREAIQWTVSPGPIAVDADRGWQSTGRRVEAGQTYRIEAEGRFTIGAEPDGTPWPCEANGITLAYHAGRPLGELLATVDAGAGAFAEWTPIGVGANYTPPATGTLFLRLNDSPASLAENTGSVRVAVGLAGGG